MLTIAHLLQHTVTCRDHICIYAWTKSNNLLLNSNETTCAFLNLDPAEYAEYNARLNLRVSNTMLDMHTQPTHCVSTSIDPNLTYNKQIDDISANAQVFYSAKRGKHKELLLSTYKTVTLCSHISSTTNIMKLQTIQIFI